MNNLTTFTYLSNDIRVVTIDDQPWFVAKDVCDTLSIVNVSDACSNLAQDENRSLRINGGRYGRPNLVTSESGLYKLIMRSDNNLWSTAIHRRCLIRSVAALPSHSYRSPAAHS